jgi:hypothetical protein
VIHTPSCIRSPVTANATSTAVRPAQATGCAGGTGVAGAAAGSDESSRPGDGRARAVRPRRAAPRGLVRDRVAL